MDETTQDSITDYVNSALDNMYMINHVVLSHDERANRLRDVEDSLYDIRTLLLR